MALPPEWDPYRARRRPFSWLRRMVRAALRPRRLLGVAFMLAVAYGVFHLIFRTDVLDPVLAAVGPVQEGIEWVRADPSRAIVALCVVIFPHIGLYVLLFENHR